VFVPFLVFVGGSRNGSEVVVQRPVVVSPADGSNGYEVPNSNDGGLEVAGVAFFFLAGVPSAVFLGRRLRRRH
jgi:hypothetical protein